MFLNFNNFKMDINMFKGLEKDIEEREVFNVLKYMKNNKFFGSDGYIVEFFKFFWSDIRNYVVRVINCIFFKKEFFIF